MVETQIDKVDKVNAQVVTKDSASCFQARMWASLIEYANKTTSDRVIIISKDHVFKTAELKRRLQDKNVELILFDSLENVNK